jgi:hypothetical protein
MAENHKTSQLPPPVAFYCKQAYEKNILKRGRFVKKIKRKHLTSHLETKPQTKKTLEVVKIECHQRGCGGETILLCPCCRNGTLETDREQLTLYCQHCHTLVKDLYCNHGHKLNPSYIREKQKQWNSLQSKTNKIPFIATFVTLGVFGIVLEFIISVLGYLGGYY